jgi:hypothetical protein
MNQRTRATFIRGWVLALPLILAAASCDNARSAASDPAAVSVVKSALTSGTTKINCGGPAVSPFIADTDFSGGSTITRTNTIDLSGVIAPAPAAVYQSQRFGDFSYTLSGFASGSLQTVRLHFADTHWTSPGQRLFNVSINGTQVLSSFDVIGTAGAGNKALIETFTVPASSSGAYVITFTTVKDASTISGIEILPATSVQINAGGPAVSPFVADTNFAGGSPRTRTNTIDLSAVYNPAPMAVYQSQRFGNFTYTLTGIAAGSWNLVRLHFADTHWTAAGARVFNVSINGTAVLTNFDIIATVGAGNKALVESFVMPASSAGQYVVTFTTVTDAATVSGIEVAPSSGAGTPTTVKGTAYATQCAQQLVPLPPPFGGGGDCAGCFNGTGPCVMPCMAGAWKYSGQLNNVKYKDGQSFNGAPPVDLFYWESSGSAPGLCMAAARQGGSPATATDFFGVICQAASGAVCFWDQVQPSPFQWATPIGGTGHVVIPSSAITIASTTPPSPSAFVGGTDLTGRTNPLHMHQGACSDCHAGQNAFNNHPGTATDLPGLQRVTSMTNWFPVAWPAPIAPAWDSGMAALGAPWALNPCPRGTSGFNGSACFQCHDQGKPGGGFPTASALTPQWCSTMLFDAVTRLNQTCTAGDLNCPTGAMPPSPTATIIDSASDPYPAAVLAVASDPEAGIRLSNPVAECLKEFRTQLRPLPGGGSVANRAGTLSTVSYDFPRATTYGIDSAGNVIAYDPDAETWSATGGTASQLSVGTNEAIWTLRKTSTSTYACTAVCRTPVGGGPCTWSWICDSRGEPTFGQIVAGNGTAVYIIDTGGYGLWSYDPLAVGQYTPDSFDLVAEWPTGDPIAQVTIGGDGDMWVLSANGNLSHETAPLSNTFTAVAPPPGGKVVSLSAANQWDVWAASSTGLYRYVAANNSWEPHCGVNDHFTSAGVCSASAFTNVVAGGNSISWVAEVWALDSSGNAYRVDRQQGPSPNTIIQIPGTKLSHISVGSQGDVMGVASSGKIYSFQ